MQKKKKKPGRIKSRFKLAFNDKKYFTTNKQICQLASSFPGIVQSFCAQPNASTQSGIQDGHM